MSPHSVFPPQVVDLVIGELADSHENYPTWSPRYTGAYEALRSCALVSKKWAGRSRVRLFEAVKVEVREGRPALLPPPSILPYVRKLEVLCSPQSFTGYWPKEEPSTPDLLKAFSTAPIERLVITGGALANQRGCVQEFINAHSATLQTVGFKGCSLSAHNISDIVLGNRCVKRLHLTDCKSERLPPGRPLIADTPGPGARSKVAELELYISGDDPEDGPADMATMIARLPYRFSKLDVDHRPTEEPEAMTATSELIKANGDTLSSLRIHIFAEDMDIEIEREHMPSLDGCSNLSELTLDMEHSESNALRDAIDILSTLNPAKSDRLGKIALEVRYVSRWFDENGTCEEGEEDEEELDEDGPAGCKERWEGLDAILSKLAKASISRREKRLTFTLMVMEWSGNKKLMPVVKKWLPKLLPRFNGLGLLHVHYARGGHCRAVDDSCLCQDKPGCLTEDSKDSCPGDNSSEDDS